MPTVPPRSAAPSAAWAAARRRAVGRPGTATEVVELVLRIAGENPGYGYTRIRDTLRSLGAPDKLRDWEQTVDRVDEPHLINGSPDKMRAFIWPMLDNKFLKHPGLGLKLMLPLELTRFLDREEKQFYERARLDKQNLISNFEWSGEALFDVANARLKACSAFTISMSGVLRRTCAPCPHISSPTTFPLA